MGVPGENHYLNPVTSKFLARPGLEIEVNRTNASEMG